MFFRKNKLRKKYNMKLISLLEESKLEWRRNQALVEQGIDPSDELIFKLRTSQARYFFLLREAKFRNVSLEKLK